MKYLCFFLKQLFSSVKNDLLMYIIFIIMTSISSCTLIYINAMQYRQNETDLSEGTAYRTVTVNFSAPPKPESVERFIKNGKVAIENFSMMIINENETVIGELIPRRHPVYDSFTKEETDNAEAVVFASSQYLFENQNAESVVLGGREYAIKGELFVPMQKIFLLPYTTMLKNFEIERAEILLTKVFTKEELEYIPQLLTECGIEVESVIAPDYDAELQSRQQAQLVFLGAVYLVSMINLAYLFYYILTKRKRTFCLYRIIGLSRRKTAIFMLSEMFLLFTISFFVGHSLCSLVFMNLMKIMFDITPVKIAFSSYMWLYLTLLLVTLVATGVMLIRFLKPSVIGEFKESEGDR